MITVTPIKKIHTVAVNHEQLQNVKFKDHTVCVLTGVTLLIITSYIPSDLAIHYLSPISAGLPGIIQEIIDYIKRIM